jgi:hypothetical protein
MMLLSDIWQLLSRVKTLTLNAASIEPEWNGIAEGQVNVSKINGDTLIFSESGEWNSDVKPRIRFFNIYRWRLMPDEILELSHLRNGMDSPVQLLNFKISDGGQWHSLKPHLCREDIYTAVLSIERDTIILLNWTIEGPSKSQSVRCFYQ